MINDEQQAKAALFALDLLEGEERASFEAELKRNEALRREVASFRDAVARMAVEESGEVPPPPHVWERISRRLWEETDAGANVIEFDASSSELGRSELLPEPAPPLNPEAPARERGRPVRWAWPAAALILLGLNVFQALRAPDSTLPPDQPEVANVGAAAAGSGTLQQLEDLSRDELIDELSRLVASNEELERQVKAQDTALATRSRELRELQSSSEISDEELERVLRDYEQLAARMMPYFEPTGGMSRFTVIELVDRETFDSNGPRRGFTQMAERVLQNLDQGNIAQAGPGATVRPSQSGDLAYMEGQTSSLNSLNMETFRIAQYTTDTAQPATTPSAPPSAFTVWRDDDQKGFLDISNLDNAPPGYDYQLWVSPSKVEPFIPVGNIPDDPDRFLSLFYEVDEPNFSPSSIMVTLEPEGGSETPQGRVILRGP